MASVEEVNCFAGRIEQLKSSDLYVVFKCKQSNFQLRLLVDTGSDITLVKLSKLRGDTDFRDDKLLMINGISDGGAGIKTLGYTFLDFFLSGDTVLSQNKVQIVPDNFPLDTDGIIGNDFLYNHEVLIDYKIPRRIVIPFAEIPMENKNSMNHNSRVLRAQISDPNHQNHNKNSNQNQNSKFRNQNENQIKNSKNQNQNSNYQNKNSKNQNQNSTFQNQNFKIQNENQNSKFQNKNPKIENLQTIPSRSEVMVFVNVINKDQLKEGVINKREIKKGVYLSQCVTKVNSSGQALASILNTNEKPIDVGEIKVKLEPFSSNSFLLEENKHRVRPMIKILDSIV